MVWAKNMTNKMPGTVKHSCVAYHVNEVHIVVLEVTTKRNGIQIISYFSLFIVYKYDDTSVAFKGRIFHVII